MKFGVMLVLVNLAATLFMTGLIWFVQVIHYPLFSKVGEAGFAEYEAAHSQRTTWVVGPPMLAEAFSGVLLVASPPSGAAVAWYWVGLGLIAVIWASTAFVQVPRHAELGQGFDAAAHRVLVVSNWVRTVMWSARSVLMLVIVAHQMRGV